VSGVQASTLSRSKDRYVWEDQQVVIVKGPFKGYHGLIKAQCKDGVDVDLDAKLASSGSIRKTEISLMSYCVLIALKPKFSLILT